MNNTFLDQMLMKASAPTPTSVGAQKQAAVATAADAKKQALGGAPNFTADQMYPMMAGAQTGAGDASATQAELDARYMAPMALWEKYGYNDQTNTLIGNRAEAQQRLTGDQSIQRDWNQTAADAVSGVGLGAFNGLAGIGALATGIVNRDAGNAMSQGIQSVNEAVMDSQSPALQGRRRVNQALNFNDQRDSTQQFEQDLAAGESGFWSGASRIARDAGTAIANAAADPATLLDGTAQAVGSVIGVGPLSRAAAAINSRGILAARKAGIIGASEARMLATAAEKGGTATLIGGMEAGGAFQQTANEVLGMDFPTLMKNSPEFNKLVDEGLSMEEARATLANTAGLKAAAITAPAAVAMGKFVAKFEAAPMSAASMKASLANIGTQVLEEAGQGGVSQMASNKALQVADNTKTLSEGVGEQVGTGALFGGLMAGTTQAPGMAALAAQKALARAALGKRGDKEEEPGTPEPSVPTMSGTGQSLVPMTTDLAENAKVAAQVSDAQEQLNIAATESIQNNPTLDDETKAVQLNGLAMLEATFTFGDTDKQDVAQRLLPEELKAKLGTARNMPEAFVALTDHVIGMTDAIAQGTKPTAEFIQAVSYLNEMSDRVEGLAGIPEVGSIMDSLQEGSPESDYLSGIYQAMANIEGSQQVVAMQEAVRQRMAQAPILEQVSLDNIPEVHARAKYAPQTLAQNVIDDTLVMADAGQIQLSEAQRVRLMASQALVSAMAQGNTTDAVNAVSRQIAFNEGSEGGFKYPSLVEHTGSITKAVISGDMERAKNDMVHLRNFAQTMTNKANAINESAGTNKKIPYQNWIPRKNEWRQSATGLNADLKGEKTTAFAQRIYTEALLAQATYENMAAHFPALAEGVDALTGVPEMSMALQDAVRQYSAPTAPAAPKNVKSRITEEQVARLSDAGLNARIEAIQDKKEKTDEDQATFVVLNNEMTKREDAAIAAQKAEEQTETPAPVAPKQETTTPVVNKVEKKSPGVAAISKLEDAELNSRIRFIEQNNKPAALEKNSVYQALVAERTTRSERANQRDDTAPKAQETPTPPQKQTANTVTPEPSEQVSKEQAMVNALAAKLKLPVVTATDTAPTVVEEPPATVASNPDQKSILDGLDTLMPDLDGRPNVLVASFEPGSNPKSRIAGMAQPIAQVLAELGDSKTAEQIMGKKVSPEKRKAALSYVQNVVKTLAEQTANRIDLTMMRKAKSGTRGTWLAMAAIGQVPPDHPDRAKAFQLLPNGGGALAAVMNYAQFPDGSPGALVNPRLVESAALAAGQWYLSSGNSGSKKLDESTVSGITGVPQEMVNDTLISLVSQGMDYKDVIRGIADAITQAWNLRIKDDAPIAKAEAVINSMAAELFYSMIHGQDSKGNLSKQFFERVDILVDTGSGNVIEVAKDSDKLRGGATPEGQQLISRYLPRKLEEGQESISTVLPNLLGVPVDDVIYFDPADIAVSDVQQHSAVPLSPAEQKAQERQQQTGFTLNTPFMQIHSLFSDKDMIELLGTPVDDTMNVATRESAEGKNTTVMGGWNQVRNVVAQVTAEAEARGVAPDELPIYYRYESISTARSMMRGRYNPQSDKGMRQAFTSMQSEADLTDPDQKLLWDTAALQMTGARVYAMKPEDISPKAEALFAQPEMVAAIDAIAQALQGNKDITGSTLVPLLKAAAAKTDDGLTNELIHVLTDRARYNMADKAGRKSFKSRLYIEADGVANGPAGAMAMLTTADSPSELGAFIQAAAKTGFFIGDPTMNMNQYRQVDGVDTYATAGKGASEFAGARLQDRSIALDNPNTTPEQKKTLLQLDVQHRTVLDVMSTLMPDGSFKVSTNENGYTSLEISRKVTKNPVTITVYGSGKKGIAGNLAGAMIEEITDRISRAAKEGIDVADAFGGQEAFNRLMDQLQRLTMNEPGYKKGELSYIWNPNSKKNVRRNLPNLRNKKDLQKFKFSPVEVTSLVNNLTEFFVNDLNSGIKSSLGSSVLSNSELMVQASNYQSLAAIHVYNTEMKQLIDSKVAENPDWDYVRDGFSKNDLKALRQKLKAVAPLLRTAMQAWDTSDSSRVASEHVAGSTLSGEYPVQHLQRTPSMSGVRVAPFLVIGMGDAAMVTNLFNDLELPEGTMQVYDGINLPFVKAREGGVAANKAIAEAWLNNNPLRTLLESFEAVAKSVDMDAALASLAKTDPKQAKMIENGLSAETVLERLRDGAARIDALHAAIKEVGYSIDQMAATGATHSVEGTATAEDAEAMLVEAYVSHLGAPIDEQAKEAVTSWLNDLPVDGSGNKVIYAEGLKLLASSDRFEPHHREMVRRILAVHADRLKDMQVVIATEASDLSRYLSPAREASLKSGMVKGYWLEDTKTLVLGKNADSSTIAHEIVHAATYQILRQHFEKGLPDTKWGTAVDTSIQNLQALLFEFYEQGATNKQLNTAADKRMARFQMVLANILRTDGTEPGASIAALWESATQNQRAQAVAEFIAHVTTDDTLRSLAKSTLVKRIKDSVIRFLRMVVLGPLGLEVKGPVTDDILSQVQFHTEVISAAQADMGHRGLRDLIVTPTNPLAQATLLPNDEQAMLMSKAFEQRVGRYLVAAPSVFDAVGRATEALKATTMASDLATDAAAAGFLQTPAQRLAFTQMVSALSTQAKIAPAVAQASYKLYVQALDALDGKLTADQQDFLRGRTGLRVDAFDRSTLVPAFVALGLVDPVMRNALANVDIEGRTKVEGNIDKRLEALGNNALAAVQDMLTGANRSKNVEEALANMAEMVAKQAHIEQNLATRMEAATMGAMGKANDWVANTLADKAQALSKAASTKAGKTKSKVMKAAAQTTSLVANVFSDAGAAANAEAALSMVNAGKSDFLKGLVKDLTGRVDSNALVYDLIKQVSQRVSKARQFYREQLPSVIAKAFSKLPTDEQNTTMFKMMAKTGLASLVQGDNFAAAFDTALDDTKRAAEIARIEGELKKETPRTEGRIRKKAKLLAEYMTTGVVQAGLLRNADAVANLLDDGVSGMAASGAEQSQGVVDLVDQLITLYAVDKVPASELEAMRQLRAAEPEGTERVLGVLKHQMDADKARHVGAARFNAWKGYIPSDGAAGGSLIVADTRDHKNLTRKGYRKVADYKGTSLFNTANMAYYYTPVGKAPFNQGIIQNARMTAGGVDQSTGFAVGFPTAGRITQKATVERLAKNAHLDSSREALLAVYDDEGRVIAFERSIDPDQLERLKPSTNILTMLGQWMGRQAEEEMAQAVNFDAVAKVHEMWNTGKHRKGEFVNVLDAKSYGNDPVLKDALRILPADVISHAESLYGRGQFWVRKDMLEDVFGYRDASIGDAWTGNSRWSPKTQERVRKLAETYLGEDAFRLLVQGEERWKNLVKDAKTLIVVKSVIVPAANFVANIFQMLARGVPMTTIARGLRDKTLEVDFYVKTHVEQMDLAVQLMALGSKDTNQRQKLEARIQAIEDSWKRLSIWPLLAAGEFGSISDAGIGRDEILLSEGKLQAYIESKTEKLPPALQRAGKWALITKDTALFQGLQKSMEYGDFLAKAIMYEHHLAKGKTKAEALGEITDEFVNYDRHPGRVRGYVEDLGLAWFYNYKLRIAKTAFNMLRKDPLRVALLAGMGLPGMELPVTENVFTKAVEGTLGHSIGPGMLFSAPGLNPWVAAMQ